MFMVPRSFCPDDRLKFFSNADRIGFLGFNRRNKKDEEEEKGKAEYIAPVSSLLTVWMGEGGL